MTRRQHIFFFVAGFTICLVLILILDPPNRNFIPIVWVFLGFVLYGYLLFKAWARLCFDLITNHWSQLDQLGIRYNRSVPWVKSISLLSVLGNQKELKENSEAIGHQIALVRLYFHFTWIGFVTFAMLGTLTVVLTWSKFLE